MSSESVPPRDASPSAASTASGSRAARLFTLALVLIICAIAGAWFLGAFRWPGARRPFAELQRITTPPPMPRTMPAPTRAVDQAGVLIVLRDGQTLVSVDRNGRVMGLPDRSEETMKIVAQVLTDGVLPRPASIDGLATGLRATLASSVPDAVARPIEPVGTLVRDARPTFRWRPQYGASGYRVTLRDEQGAVVKVSDVVPTTNWRIDEALASGRTYAWTVEAVDGGGAAAGPGPGAGLDAAKASAPSVASAPSARDAPNAPNASNAPSAPGANEARFRVMDASAAGALDERLTRAGRSNLLKALAFIQAGLLTEAERALVALSTDNDGSDRVRGLVESLRSMRATSPAAASTPASSRPTRSTAEPSPLR